MQSKLTECLNTGPSNIYQNFPYSQRFESHELHNTHYSHVPRNNRLHSEKYIRKQFHCCVNITECTYAHVDGTASDTPRLGVYHVIYVVCHWQKRHYEAHDCNSFRYTICGNAENTRLPCNCTCFFEVERLVLYCHLNKRE